MNLTTSNQALSDALQEQTTKLHVANMANSTLQQKVAKLERNFATLQAQLKAVPVPTNNKNYLTSGHTTRFLSCSNMSFRPWSRTRSRTRQIADEGTQLNKHCFSNTNHLQVTHSFSIKIKTQITNKHSSFNHL